MVKKSIFPRQTAAASKADLCLFAHEAKMDTWKPGHSILTTMSGVRGL